MKKELINFYLLFINLLLFTEESIHNNIKTLILLNIIYFTYKVLNIIYITFKEIEK